MIFAGVVNIFREVIFMDPYGSFLGSFVPDVPRNLDVFLVELERMYPGVGSDLSPPRGSRQSE